MEILCVIVNYRTPEMTLDAVRAARRALERFDHRIDLVDNDSGDGSYEALSYTTAQWSDVNVLRTEYNGGFGYGNNYAIRRAFASEDPPDYVYILNSDAFPEPDAIEALVRFLRLHPHAGIAGSEIH